MLYAVLCSCGIQNRVPDFSSFDGTQNGKRREQPRLTLVGRNTSKAGRSRRQEAIAGWALWLAGSCRKDGLYDLEGRAHRIVSQEGRTRKQNSRRQDGLVGERTKSNEFKVV